MKRVNNIMKLFPIRRDDTGAWNACGPAVLSALTGVGTQQCRDSLRLVAREILGKTNRRIASGVSEKELTTVLNMYSFSTEHIYVNKSEEWTLSRFLLWKQQEQPGTTWMVIVQGKQCHVVACNDNMIIDNHKPEGCVSYNHPYADAIVISIHKVEQTTMSFL